MTSSEVRDAVREASAARTPLRIAGSGTWLDAGRPVKATRTLSLASLTGVVNYEPGDFTSPLAPEPRSPSSRRPLPHRQFLALDPFGAPNGTLGATVATGANGPMSYAFGGPRDNAIGLEVITGDGSVVRCGGRVVKNVAGFDLTRLFTGSWGTLGVITEVSVRLRALPAVDETYALSVDDRDDDLERLIAALRVAPIAPFAWELVSPGTSFRRDSAITLLVRLGGNGASVRAQQNALAAFGDPQQVPTDVWSALRGSEPSNAIVARLSTIPSRAAKVWTNAREATAGVRDAMLLGSIGRGVVR